MKTTSLLILAALFIQCAAKKQPESSIKKTPEGKWQLIQLNDFTTPLDSLNKIPTLNLSLSDSTYSGNSSCNNFHGGLLLKESSIRFNPAMMTKMFCPDNYNMEPSFMQMLDKANSYQLKGSELILLYKETELAVFTPVKK